MASTIKTTISIGGTLEPSVQASFSKISSYADSISSKFSTFAKVGGAAITAFAVKSVNTFTDFESAMSNVKALLGDNATPEAMQQLTDKAKEMGKSTSKSATDSANALGYMALAGWDVEQQLAGLEPILRASEAGGMDLALCSDLVTDSMSAMGIQVNDLQHYLDVATKAQSSSNTSLEQVMEAYVSCGGTLKNMNVSVEESATVLGTLANRGIKGSEAGNALNSVLVNLMGTTSTTAGALESIGVSAYDSDGKFRGLHTVLTDLGGALSKCTDEQRDMITAQLGGKTQMDTLQAMLAGVSEEYDTLNEKLNNCDGALLQTAQTMQDNLKGQLTSISSAAEGVAISFGERLEPYLSSFFSFILDNMPNVESTVLWVTDNIINAITNIANSEAFESIKEITISIFSTLSENGPQIISILSSLIPIIAGISSYIMTLKIATKIAAFIKIIGKVKSIISTIGVAFTAVSGGAATLGEGIAFLMGPIGWVALAIGAIVAVVTLLYAKCEPFRNMVNSLISSAVSWISGTLLPAIASIGEKFSGLITSISGFATWLWGYLGPIFTVIFSAASGVVSSFVGTIGSLLMSAMTIIGGIIDFVSGVFSGNWSLAWEGIKEIFRGVFDGLLEIAAAPLNSIIGLVNGAIEGINKLGFNIGKIPSISVGGGDSSGGDSSSSSSSSGYTSTSSLRGLPQFASGGFTNVPSICGEDGPEAVIPLRRSARSLSLLEKTSSVLGANNSSNSGGNTFVFAPNISDNVSDESLRKIRDEYENFKEAVLRIFEEERRESFV